MAAMVYFTVEINKIYFYLVYYTLTTKFVLSGISFLNEEAERFTTGTSKFV